MNVTKAERDKIILDNLKLIYKIINKHFPNADFGEYVNQAIISFIKAIEKYDPNKKVRLTTFAYRVIKNDLMDYTMRNRAIPAPVSRKTIPTFVFESDLEREVSDNIFKSDSEAFEMAHRDEIIQKINGTFAPAEAKAFNLLIEGKTFKEIKKLTGVDRKKLNRLAKLI